MKVALENGYIALATTALVSASCYSLCKTILSPVIGLAYLSLTLGLGTNLFGFGFLVVGKEIDIAGLLLAGIYGLASAPPIIAGWSVVQASIEGKLAIAAMAGAAICTYGVFKFVDSLCEEGGQRERSQ